MYRVEWKTIAMAVVYRIIHLANFKRILRSAVLPGRYLRAGVYTIDCLSLFRTTSKRP